MNAPILITGCARSGTSMVAGIVNLCGAFGGQLSGPTSNNRKGMFENSEIRNNIVKPYLRGIGADPMGQDPLPDLNKVASGLPGTAKKLRKAVVSTMRRQGYKDGPWFYKGAKLCLIWPLWDLAFPDAKWIVVRRPDEEIAASCLATSFMRAHHTAAGWQKWIDQHKARFQEMFTADIHSREIWSTSMIAGKFDDMLSVIDWCGLEWQGQAVREFVSPELWMSKEKAGS